MISIGNTKQTEDRQQKFEIHALRHHSLSSTHSNYLQVIKQGMIKLPNQNMFKNSMRYTLKSLLLLHHASDFFSSRQRFKALTELSLTFGVS